MLEIKCSKFWDIFCIYMLILDKLAMIIVTQNDEHNLYPFSLYLF